MSTWINYWDAQFLEWQWLSSTDPLTHRHLLVIFLHLGAHLCSQVEPFLPYEYTCEGMLERVHAYIQNQVSIIIQNSKYLDWGSWFLHWVRNVFSMFFFYTDLQFSICWNARLCKTIRSNDIWCWSRSLSFRFVKQGIGTGGGRFLSVLLFNKNDFFFWCIYCLPAESTGHKINYPLTSVWLDCCYAFFKINQSL